MTLTLLVLAMIAASLSFIIGGLWIHAVHDRHARRIDHEIRARMGMDRWS